jgi:DNA recombination protein RmuC
MILSDWFASPLPWLLLVASLIGSGILYQRNVRLSAQHALLQQQLDTVKTAHQQEQQQLQTTLAELRTLQDFAIEAKTWQTQLETLQPQLTALQQQQQLLAIEKATLLTEKEGLLQQLTAQQTLWEAQQTEWKTLWDAQLKNHLTETLTQANQSLKRSAEEEEQARLVGFKQLTAPLQKMLEDYEQKIKEIDQRHSNKVTLLDDNITKLHQMQYQLASVLKTNKGAGDWGELVLRRILELSGLIEGLNYQFQATQANQSRPDVIVNLPNGRTIIIDAKAARISSDVKASTLVPTEDEPSEVVDVATDLLKGKALVDSIKKSVDELASKSKLYLKEQKESPDFMILFLPKESTLSEAMLVDPTIWQWAWQKKIVISSPFTLIPLLRMIHEGWVGEKLTADLSEIKETAIKIHEKLCTFSDNYVNLLKSYKGLGVALDKFRSPVIGKGGVITLVEDLEKLQVRSAKHIHPQLIEALDKSSFDDETAVIETPLLPVLQ